MISTVRLLPLMLILAVCSCAPKRIADHATVQRSAGPWAIVQQTNSEDFLVFAEDQINLEEALRSMGCRRGPCAISRLGDVYQARSLSGK